MLQTGVKQAGKTATLHALHACAGASVWKPHTLQSTADKHLQKTVLVHTLEQYAI